MRKKRVITTGNVTVTIKIIYHRCPRCRYRTPDRQELTLTNGVYDRFIALQACVLYTCGCSYENVQGLLATTSDVLPAKSTIQAWIKKVGNEAHQVNKDALAELKADTVQIDEQFFYGPNTSLTRT